MTRSHYPSRGQESPPRVKKYSRLDLLPFRYTVAIMRPTTKHQRGYPRASISLLRFRNPTQTATLLGGSLIIPIYLHTWDQEVRRVLLILRSVLQVRLA
jgi:hypothetical protein